MARSLVGRRVRTRRLIQAGALGDSQQVAHWAAFGGRACAPEAELDDDGKEAIILAFPAPLAREATTLRAAGFRSNKLLPNPSPTLMAALRGVLPARYRPLCRLGKRLSEVSGSGASWRACRQSPPVRDRRRAEAQVSALTLY
jgi:hypothetical protein